MPSLCPSSLTAVTKYPRLTRSTLIIAVAISADQVVNSYAGEVPPPQRDFFDEPSVSVTELAVMQSEPNVTNKLNRFEEFLNSSPDRNGSKARSLQDEVDVEVEEDPNAIPDDIRSLTIYPEPYFTDEQMRQGGFLLYIMGIMYAFLGISLATQDYINPSIDIIKKKGVLSSESMNATLLAMTNSAAESFIIMNSIFFGVSDIGISTVVQQAAFYSFIVQSVFYLIVKEKTLIDWWIITRETVFILLYLIVISVFLFGNRVELWKALILVLIYIIHIFLMKFSSKYEVAIKQALANRLEINTLKKIAKEDITRFHMNLKTEAISIEMLNKVHFTLRDDYIVFKDSLIRKKLRLSNSIKSGEEKYADKNDKTLMARKNWKEAVSMIIIKLQAYKHNLQIQRTQQCRQRLSKMLPMINTKEVEDDEKIFGESYDSEEESVVSEHASEIEVKQYESEDGQSLNNVDASESPIRKDEPKKLGELIEKSGEGDMGVSPSGDLFGIEYEQRAKEQDAFNKTYAQYIDHQPAQQQPPSRIYELIMHAFYKGQNKIAWPETARRRIVYVALIPLTHMQYLTIPNPMRGKNGEKENLYPITLFMSLLWIWVYSGIIVWFTFDLTVALNMKFNVLPMVLYPFGIALRDYKKKVNLEQAIKMFNERLREQRMSLAETFSAQIFQITGLMGLTWTLYISLKGTEYVSFINESIQYQMPLLTVVVVIKYMLLVCSKYRTSRALFYVNLACYLVFVSIIAIIDYRVEIFG